MMLKIWVCVVAGIVAVGGCGKSATPAVTNGELRGEARWEAERAALRDSLQRDVVKRSEVKPLGDGPSATKQPTRSMLGDDCNDPTEPLNVTKEQVLNAFGPVGKWERLEFVLNEDVGQYYCRSHNVGLHFELNDQGQIMRITLATTQGREVQMESVDRMSRFFTAYQQLASACDPGLDRMLGNWVLHVHRLIGTESELRASGHRLVVMATAREMSPGQCGLMCRISRLQ